MERVLTTLLELSLLCISLAPLMVHQPNVMELMYGDVGTLSGCGGHPPQTSPRLMTCMLISQAKIKTKTNRALGVSPSGGLLRKAESLPTRAVSLERKRSLEGVIEKILGMESFIGGKTILEDDEAQFEKSMILPIVEREYAQGVLISEIVKDPLMSRHKRNRQRQQVKESKRPGETIIKGHRSYDLMLDLQLGMRYVYQVSGSSLSLSLSLDRCHQLFFFSLSLFLANVAQ